MQRPSRRDREIGPAPRVREPIAGRRDRGGCRGCHTGGDTRGSVRGAVRRPDRRVVRGDVPAGQGTEGGDGEDGPDPRHAGAGERRRRGVEAGGGGTERRARELRDESATGEDAGRAGEVAIRAGEVRDIVGRRGCCTTVVAGERIDEGEAFEGPEVGVGGSQAPRDHGEQCGSLGNKGIGNRESAEKERGGGVDARLCQHEYWVIIRA